MSMDTAIICVGLFITACAYGVVIRGAIATKGGFFERVDGGFEELKDVVRWPVMYLQRRSRQRVEAAVAVELLTKEFSRTELSMIAKKQPLLFGIVARDIAKPAGPGSELGDAIGSMMSELSNFASSFQKGLAKHGLQLDVENIRAMNDEKKIGDHNPHGSGIYTPGCPRCDWLADDVVRPESIVNFEDSRVQFDIRRNRVRLLEDEGREAICFCHNERRTNKLHVRSCPMYGTLSEL